VRNLNERAILHGPAQSLHHTCFCFTIERSCWFIEEQNRTVTDNRSCDPDPLPLAAGESQAPITNERVIAIRHFLNEVVGVGGFRGSHYLFERFCRAARGDGFPYNPAE